MKPNISRQPSLAKLLSHRPSKLDLIDDTTLTSLPFPPPMKSKRRTLKDHLVSSRDNNYNKQNITNDFDTTLEIDDDFRQETLVNKDGNANGKENGKENRDKYNIKNDHINNDIDIEIDEDLEETMDDLVDESYQDGEETEDPIVLVEDYIYRNTSNFERLQRKKSLATFKEKMHEDVNSLNTLSQSQFNTNKPFMGEALQSDLLILESETSSHSGSEVSYTHTKRPQKNPVYGQLLLNLHRSCLEDLEGVFGKIPGTETLNYCELCEKPLYELSALINKRNEKKQITNKGYKEFICWECIGDYEIYSREFPTCRLKEQHLEKVKNIFKSIETKYGFNVDSVPKQLQEEHLQGEEKTAVTQTNDGKRKFSDPLLQLLRELRVQANSSASSDWIMALQERFKLRWRFRLFPGTPQLQPS